jgi:hypothetical protein
MKYAMKVIAAAALLTLAHASFSQTVAKSWAYKPFTVTSTKLKREVSDAYIADKLMCKSTLQNMAKFMDLVRDFDLLRTSAMDGSVSMTVFQGKQEGSSAEVAFFVDSRTRLLQYIWVNGAPALQCNL